MLEAELQKAKDIIQTLKQELEEAKSIPLKENRLDKMRYSLYMGIWVAYPSLVVF